MKLRTLAIMVCMTGLASACATKQIETEVVDPAAHTVKQQVKKEDKKDTKQAKEDAKELTCMVNKDARLISLEKTEKRCEVHYTKNGETNQVAWGESTPSICDDVFNNIKTNIEKEGFKCSDSKDDKKTQTASM